MPCALSACRRVITVIVVAHCRAGLIAVARGFTPRTGGCRCCRVFGRISRMSSFRRFRRTVPAMARAQRPQRALPTPRACERPEHSGGPGRRKNLERRLRRGREEAGLSGRGNSFAGWVVAAPAGSSAWESHAGTACDIAEKATNGLSARRQDSSDSRRSGLTLMPPRSSGDDNGRSNDRYSPEARADRRRTIQPSREWRTAC